MATNSFPPPTSSDAAEPPAPWPSRLIWPVFLAAFGFLLTSYPARNIDIWGHLVAGRDAMSGLGLGTSFTPLFDLLVAAGHAAGGGGLLVFGKAAAMGLLGVLLYEAARTHSYRVLPAVAVGLSLMAVSLRANLQPQAVTYLFLGATVFWLTRHRGLPAWRSCWPLLVLFAAWANLDRGFVYGLATVALVWLGRVVDAAKESEAATGRPSPVRVAGVLAALAGVCLLNPASRTGEFPLPLELQWLTTRGAGEALRSPVTAAYLRSVTDNPAALAYYALLALSAFGVALNRRGFRWERFFPSLVLGVLSVASDRAVPIFAVVAGPMAALNLGESLARSSGFAPRGPRSPWRRRLAAPFPFVVAGLFLVAAWPGWLQRPPYEPRRWAFDLPTAPAVAAEYLRGARTLGADGPADRTLHLSAESRTAFRWACPEDDGRYDPDLAAALVYGRPIDAELRAGGFTRVVVYHSNLESVRPVLNVLLRDRYRWPLLDVGGDAAVFGWRDPDRADEPFRGRDIDLAQVWHPRLEVDRVPVPADGPDLAVPTWRQALRNTLTRPRVVHSRNRDEAALLTMMAEVSQRWVPELNGLSWYFEQTAGLVGGAGASINPLLAAADAALRFNAVSPPTADRGPPPLLAQTVGRQFDFALASKDDYFTGAIGAAIRAGRRAVADDPNDPRAHVLLGEAYLTILFDSRERVWATEFKQLRELRQAQAATALHRAVRLSRTPPAQAHRLLSLMYRRIGYLDLCLDHLIEARQADALSAPGATPDPEAEKDYERLRDHVRDLRGQFDKESAGLRLSDRATLAGRLNLHGQALETLLKSDISAFGAAGVKQQLELMIRTGRAGQVVEWTSPEQRDAVGTRSYHWLRAQAFAGLGDYASADLELLQIGGGAADLIPDPDLLVSSLATIVSKHVLAEANAGTGLADAVWRTVARSEAAQDVRAIETRLKNLSEVSVLRAVLALEVGDVPAARRLADTALFFSPLRPGGTALPLRVVIQGLLDRTRDLETPAR